ncbi:Uu.00g010870.m01.CDS01 [Anthostomella pinea]|uniref:Uu.00g010870.m01.CDS01 n=1 Tax=Anthostomella pinea TaxID=933095 RepID=A0AAI8VXN2_9PEZI|nr:Uu.00g010870.m01.CDS01 [Anthostomella pinea]
MILFDPRHGSRTADSSGSMERDVADDQRGLFVPVWFRKQPIGDTDMNLGSLLFGFSLAVAMFAAVIGGAQTLGTWRRRHRFTAYIVMIWIEWIASMAVALLTWSYLRGHVPSSLWTFFFMVFLGQLQVQFLLQIIINRISLLIIVPGKAAKLKWGIAGLATAVGISVFCIWIPAHMQISERYVHINEVWDRMERSIFTIVDCGLSFYFIYLVRSHLIKNGLTKYKRLYRYNLVMIFVSLSLDVVLIGLMSLPNHLVYMQCHPVTYLMKLVIEMNMADLIGKVVKASNPITGLESRGSLINNPTTATSHFANAIGLRRGSSFGERSFNHRANEYYHNVMRPKHAARVNIGDYTDKQHAFDLKLGCIHYCSDTDPSSLGGGKQRVMSGSGSGSVGTDSLSISPNQSA